MKLVPKKIVLKEMTLCDINNGKIDIGKYIKYIRTNIENANYLIENKLISLDDAKLFFALSKVFDIQLDDDDLLKILKEKYNKHYIRKVDLNTKMLDEEGNNIVLVGAATKKVLYHTEVIANNDLRKIIDSYDFLVLEIKKVKHKEKVLNPEEYQNYPIEGITLDFSEKDNFFDYKLKLLKKEIKNHTVLKKILHSLSLYIKELEYQAKLIGRLGEKDDNLKDIAAQYKRAYQLNFNKESIKPKNRRKCRNSNN